MTSKGNPKPRTNPPYVPNITADPDPDPGSSYPSSYDTFESSDNKYYKQGWCAKEKKHQIRTRFDDPIKKCANLTAKLLIDSYNQRSLSSNFMSIRDIAVFISYLSWIHFKKVITVLRKIHIAYGLSIHKRGRMTRLC